MKDGGRDWSSASSTVGCNPLRFCTSGSDGESGGPLGGDIGSWTGFEALGSSPALSAFAILIAWNLANLDFAAISGRRGVCHIPRSSRKVEAARKVSAVCLYNCKVPELTGSY